MIAFVSNGRIPDFIDVREPAFAATTQETAPTIDDAAGELRAARSLALIVHRIGQVLERRRQAEIARRNSLPSMDDSWAGGWYARSRILQEALLQRGARQARSPHRAGKTGTTSWIEHLARDRGKVL